MPQQTSVLRATRSRVQSQAAYQAFLDQLPVPYEKRHPHPLRRNVRDSLRTKRGAPGDAPALGRCA